MAHLRPALVLFILFSLLTGLAYPMAVTALATMIFRQQAEGSLIKQGDAIVGSHLIGQAFSAPKYFYGRPSATTTADPKDPTKQISLPYNAANSGGSNLGPTSKALIDSVKSAADQARTYNGVQPIPVDLVTSSASGLDPDITPAAAAFQVRRVAQARNLNERAVSELVDANTHERSFGFIGETSVNVLDLNLALDALVLPQAK